FFSSRRRHTRFSRDWSSDVCSSDLFRLLAGEFRKPVERFLSRLGCRCVRKATDRLAIEDDRIGGPPDLRQLLGCRDRGVGGEKRSEERRVGTERRSRRTERECKQTR